MRGRAEELGGVQSLCSCCRDRPFPGRWKLCNEESRPSLFTAQGQEALDSWGHSESTGGAVPRSGGGPAQNLSEVS